MFARTIYCLTIVAFNTHVFLGCCLHHHHSDASATCSHHSCGDGASFIDQMRRLGVDVRVDKHNGHSDIKFRAPIWRDVHLASHDDADKLVAWLKQSGFEVRHDH